MLKPAPKFVKATGHAGGYDFPQGDKKTFESSSDSSSSDDSSSESDSADSSSAESDSEASASSSSSESDSDASASSSSSSDSSSDSSSSDSSEASDAPKVAAVRKAPVKTGLPTPAATPKVSPAKQPAAPKANTPFQRVKVAEVRYANDGVRKNEHIGPNELGDYKGKSFRQEKNKKKRGSFRGGAIDQTVRSHKFDSD